MKKWSSAGSCSKMMRDLVFVTFLLKSEMKDRELIFVYEDSDCLVCMTCTVLGAGGHGFLKNYFTEMNPNRSVEV